MHRALMRDNYPPLSRRVGDFSLPSPATFVRHFLLHPPILADRKCRLTRFGLNADVAFPPFVKFGRPATVFLYVCIS